MTADDRCQWQSEGGKPYTECETSANKVQRESASRCVDATELARAWPNERKLQRSYNITAKATRMALETRVPARIGGREE